MSHSFHQLYYHFIWATHQRLPLIDRKWRARLLEVLHEEVIHRGGKPIRHNAMPDHVHLLVRLPPTVLVSQFIGQVKGAVCFRINQELTLERKLQWQEGYGVLTIRKDEVDGVCCYIDRQEDHHRGGRLSELLERLNTETDQWIQDLEASTPPRPSPLKGAEEKQPFTSCSQP